VFQHPSLFPHLSVYQNIAFGLRKLGKAQKKEICQKMLELIGLENQADKYPHQLSGGQHQRVALARSLAPSPKIMLLDEPFANLDYILRSEIRDEVVSILKAIKVPTIMVTHSPEEALIIADKMVLLNNRGKVHQIGEPDIMHNEPVDVESAEFFGSISKIPALIEGDYIISPLGKLDRKTYASNINDTNDVLIVTRPEGIRIAKENEDCTKVKIDLIRHTGAGWLVNASLNNGNKIIYHHIYGEPPKKNSQVCVTFDPPHIFVFVS
jgi:iron(III) transport system ATP-binding protein